MNLLRTFTQLAGGAAVVYGLWLILPALAFIVAGLLLVAVSVAGEL